MLKAGDLLTRIADIPARISCRKPESAFGRVSRYAVAVALAVGAWGATLALTSVVPTPNYLLFAAAVALSTWYGGGGPGIITSVISIIAIDFSYLPPIGAIELTHS